MSSLERSHHSVSLSMLIAKAIKLLLSADSLSLINQHIHNTNSPLHNTMTTATTLTDMQQRISELFDIDSVSEVDTIIKELEVYGIKSEENLDDAYLGCYPDEETFCEDLLSAIYAEQIEAMPVFLQTAIDWELVWHQTMQYDYFAIYLFNRKFHASEYYFFNRNF